MCMQSYAECLHALQRVSGLQGAYLQLVRATPQEAQQYKEEERQARLQAIHDAAGHQSLPIITSTCLSVSCCLSDRLCLSLSACLLLCFYVRLRTQQWNVYNIESVQSLGCLMAVAAVALFRAVLLFCLPRVCGLSLLQ